MKYRNFNIKELRTFIAVAERSNMVKAGSDLHLTQGAISQQIKQLESKVNLHLFDRTGRHLTITEDGARLLEMAKEIVSLNDRAWAKMNKDKKKESIKVGIPTDLASYFISSVLSIFSQEWPSIEVLLVCGSSPELREKINKGEVDIAIIEEPIKITGGDLLTTDQLVWLGCVDGQAYRERPLNISLVTESCAFRDDVLSVLSQNGIPWKSSFNSGNIDATLAAISADIAVTAWLRSCVPHNQNIVQLHSTLPILPEYAVKLYFSNQSSSSLAKEISSYIKPAFSKGPFAHSQKQKGTRATLDEHLPSNIV